MLKALSKILGSGAAGQALNFLSLPILGSLYAPSQFGEYVLGVAIVTLMALVCTAQLNQALLLVKRKFLVSLLLNSVSLLTIFIIIGLTIILEGVFLWLLPDSESLALESRLMLYFTLFFAAKNVMHMHIFIRNGTYNAIASFTFLRVAILVGVQVVFVYTPFEINGLLFGYLVSEGLIFLLSWITVKRTARYPIVRMNFVRIGFVLKRYIRYVKTVTVQEVFNNGSQNLPIYILTGIFGAAIAGSFSLAMRLINAPSQLVANSIRPIILNKLINGEPTENGIFLKKSTVVLTLVCLIGVVMFAIIHEWLINLLFGPKWVLLPEFSLLLAFWSICMIINVPAVSFLKVREHLEFLFKYNVALIIARAFALLAGAYFDVYYSILMFVFVSVAFNIFIIFYAISKSKVHGEQYA